MAKQSDVVAKIRAKGRVTTKATHTVNKKETLLGETAEIIDCGEISAVHGVAKLALGVTVQPRKYESVRIDVGVEIPCERTDEGFKAAWDRAENLCQERMDRLSRTIT